MPTSSNLYVDPALTGVSVLPSKNNKFIATDVAPVVTSQKETGPIFRIDNAAGLLRKYDTKYAPGTETKLVDIEVDQTLTYNCVGHGLTGYVTDRERGAADAPARPAINKVQQLTDLLRLEREIAMVAAIDANVTATASPANKWNDYTLGDPITEIDAQITTIKGSGRKPNAFACDEAVLRAIKHHPDFRDYFKHVDTAGTYQSLDGAARGLATLLGLNYGFYADVTMQNTADKGQTKSLAPIWSERFLLFYMEPNPGFQTGTMAVHVEWNNPAEGGGLIGGYSVETFREAKRKSDGVIVTNYYDPKFLNAAAAYLFTGVLN